MFVKMLNVLVTFSCLFLFMSLRTNAYQSREIWGYECQDSRCVKVQFDANNSKAISLAVCRVFCGPDAGTLWPKPTGLIKLGNVMAKLNAFTIQLRVSNYKEHEKFWKENEIRFLNQINAKVPKSIKPRPEGKQLVINIVVQLEDPVLTLITDEHYKIFTVEQDDSVEVTVEATTIFGARHALETLSQLIVFDELRQELQVVGEFEINDAPQFKHRGLLLDTSRNYFSVESIKRTIDGMAMVKLNTFHWHITDSQSFPLVIKSHPNLASLGAYSPDKIYTADDIADILEYAHVRGVRVIPEFDAPAHVGEGWQKENLTTCFNFQPWQKYCVEPPCGQLDPSKDALYPILEDIYKEMFEMFNYPDVFHMGGDEVSHACWNTSSELKQWMSSQGWGHEEADFMKLWGHFQDNALARVDKVSKTKVPIIMWTSRLTDVPYVDTYLDKNRYIIQIWTTGDDSKIQDLLKRGYQLIMSNYDALYFDCGFGAWVTEGTNWCSPYIGWEKVYKNDIDLIGGQYKSQILGAEAALWSEQADEHVLDGRYWPRASALAERLWSNPTTTWREAEPRMLIHRERLVQNKISAESLQPQWCLQHEGECPIS